MSELKQKATAGIIWSGVERFSAQGVQFVLGIILARLLLPSDYGLIGMLAIFLAISQTLVDSGFETALIQKKNRDDLDFSTIFYFNIVVSLFLYLILFFSAPFIADFFEQPQLKVLTRVIGLTIIISSLGVVQRAKYTINIDFKTQTKASIISIIVSGVIGITLAYKGFGVWSLVIQAILRVLINVIILWQLSKWTPKSGFSFVRFKDLFSFGYKLLLSGLLNTIFGNAYTIIIGKMFSANNLGYYSRASQLGDFPSANITGIISRVTFPVLSEMQSDIQKLRDAYKKIIKMSALFIFPFMMGLAALAEPTIITLLTEKWRESVWMLQLLCFAAMWHPIHAINLNVITVLGRSDLYLKLEIAKKIMISLVLIISVPFGIKAMIIGQIFTSYAALIINLYYAKKVINYGFYRQMYDLAPILLLSFAMGISIYYTTMFIDSNILKLIVGFFEGLIFYVTIAWGFNFGEIRELPIMIKSMRNRNKANKI